MTKDIRLDHTIGGWHSGRNVSWHFQYQIKIINISNYAIKGNNVNQAIHHG